VATNRITRAERAFAVSVKPLGDRRVKFAASTIGVDRHGTRLLPRGCKYDNYLKNPVFLWNHRKHEEAEPDDVLGRVVNISISDRVVSVTVEFMTHRQDGSVRQKAFDAYRDVLAGILNAVSVGMIPLRESPVFKSEDEINAYLAKGGIVTVEEWELCELSLTIVPSNPDAIAQRSFSFRKAQVAAVMVHRTDGATLWGRRSDSGKYTTPAGHMNLGESPEAGAARELQEEAGLRADGLIKLGVVETPRASVHCFRANVGMDAKPTGELDPDKEIKTWEWLRDFPKPEDCHHNPSAWTKFYAPRTSFVNAEMFPTANSRSLMDPKAIFEKLGIGADAAPDAIVAALIKYLAGPDADADKSALVMGLLKMLVPAAPSTETPAETATEPDEGDEAREAALMEEMKSLRSQLDTMEKSYNELKARADKPEPAKEEEKPEEMADRAIKAGAWPDSGRKGLIERYVAKQPVKLFEKGTFTNRSARLTEGGNLKAKPNFGDSDGGIKSDVRAAFAQVEKNIGATTGAIRLGSK